MESIPIKLHAAPCQSCGECCNIPCDLVPEDLPKIANHFNLSLKEFYKKYLISYLIATPKLSNQILMMLPVKVDDSGVRTNKYLADNEYYNTKGRCIFLKNNTCTIHSLKPYGGKLYQCHKMTGSFSIQLFKFQYFPYWWINQSLYERIFPGTFAIYAKLDNLHNQMNMIADSKNEEYKELDEKRQAIIRGELFPLFNKSEPKGGYRILVE